MALRYEELEHRFAAAAAVVAPGPLVEWQQVSRPCGAFAMRAGFRTPVMVFAGLRDRVVPLANADFLAERLPNCRQATLGAGHFVWEEAPDAFAQLLCDWIDEHHQQTEVFDVRHTDQQ
jgi:pimeloyl-ACP methyl ester carboxylesterase